MNELDRIFRDNPDAEGFARGYLEYVRRVIAAIDTAAVAKFIAILLDARDRGARIFFAGNGGSAATASHFANDLAIGTRCPDQPIRALALTDNVAMMTAIANDDGYEEIFVQQLQALMQKGDVLVVISASGDSPNVIRALDYAKSRGATTVALTGFTGGRCARMADHNVHIPTNPGEYGPAEDGHLLLDHLIGAYLVRAVRDATSHDGDEDNRRSGPD